MFAQLGILLINLISPAEAIDRISPVDLWRTCIAQPAKKLVGALNIQKPQMRADGMPHTQSMSARDQAMIQSFSTVHAHGTRISLRTSLNEEIQGTVDYVEQWNSSSNGNEIVSIKTADGSTLRVPLWSILGGSVEAHVATALSPKEVAAYQTLKQAHGNGNGVNLNGMPMHPKVHSFGISMAGVPTVQLELGDGRQMSMTISQAAELLKVDASARNSFAQAVESNTPTAHKGLDYMNVSVNGEHKVAAILGFNLGPGGRILSVNLLYSGQSTPKSVTPEQLSIRLAAHVEEHRVRGANSGHTDTLDLDHNHNANDFQLYAPDPGDHISFSRKTGVKAPPAGFPVASPPPPPVPPPNTVPKYHPTIQNVQGAELYLKGDPEDTPHNWPLYNQPNKGRVQTMLELSLKQNKVLSFEILGTKITGTVTKFLENEKFILQPTGFGLPKEYDMRAIKAATINWVDK